MADPQWWNEGADPDYRFTYANERTFLAWIRTSLGLITAGVAIARLLTDVGFEGSGYLLGMPLVLAGVAVPIVAHRRWANNEQAMRTAEPLSYPSAVLLLGGWLAVSALAAIAMLIVGAVHP